MKDASILCDYFRYYDHVNIVAKLKIVLKAFVLPSDPANKICPWIRLELRAYKNASCLEKLFEWIIYKYFKCTIGSHCSIGNNIHFPHPMNIVIGHGVTIGADCVIYHDVTLGQSKGEFPKVGNSVIIFSGAKIIGGISIGDNVVIGANAVVTHDVPSNSVVVGNPARVIKKINDVSGYRFGKSN